MVKMLPPHRYVPLIFLILLTWTTAKSSKQRCPIGFNIAYTKHRGDDPMCYRRKGPETFKDKFVNCTGNLYTAKLYQKLNITETNLVLWTDYKSLYPGGPYIDWSLTDDTGDVLKNSTDVLLDNTIEDDELCVIIDPVTNYTATKCDEMHYRYCFVKPYEDEDDLSDDGCAGLEEYYRFWSPTPTCLRSVMGVGGGPVRANWRQAKELCGKKGGSLLSKGWRYANNPLFSISVSEPTFPLGLISNNISIRYDTANDNKEIPKSEWNFENSTVSTDSRSFGALRDDFWYLVNGSYMFFDVICERTIRLRIVTMNVTVDMEGKLVLYVNDTLEEKKIFCFTDSEKYYPKKVKVRYNSDSDNFILKPIGDGYYWCTHIDTRNVYPVESNKALFIREKQSLVNYYAVELAFNRSFRQLEDYTRHWQMKLEQYIFYRNKYVQVFGVSQVSNPATAEEVLKEYKASHPGFMLKDKELIYKIRVKRYVEGRTALLHVQLNPSMDLVPPGTWDDIEVLAMKPVYYCKGFDSVPMLPLGSSTTSAGCRTLTCIGNFNEGVQWVTTAASSCMTSTATLINEYTARTHELDFNMPTAHPITTGDPTYRDKDDDSSEEHTRRPRSTTPVITTTETESNETTTEAVPTKSSTSESVVTVTTPETTEEVTTVTTPATKPPSTVPPPRPPPDEQLIQIIEDLELMLNNDTEPITVEDIDHTFDQVDILLEQEEDVEIPGNLLHLLDQLGGRIDLNGSHQGSAIRSNVALLVADADAENPVRGLRISAREVDAFTNTAFEILFDEINSTHLFVNESEAVVYLPASVASSPRRISFVVFRNDRAFQDGHGMSAVNSRVLSINVEDLTQFQHGEVIDIHLSPLMEQPDRNMSRTCAYWHFNEDGTGFWSQEGCTFIRSNQVGVLDTCRCDHLTHFAEILVPRAVFSERSENALEILTIIGCCLSIFGLCMVGVTAVLFRSWRRDYSNKIWLQLCIAIFVLVVCFLIVIYAKFDTYDIPCMLLGVALHYAVIASFCWMLVAAVLSYRRLVIVFTRDASHKLLRASAFSWGVPCAVVGILLSVDPHSYAGRFEEKTPSGAFCYPSGLGLWLAVYAPIAVMLLANWTLFVLIVRSVFASRRIQRHGDTNEAVRCASVSCLLVFLFGLPWIFGLFAHNVVAAFFFTLTATFQGFVLFIFFVLGNKKTRDLWLNKLKIRQTRKVPVTSSTYTHRSTGVAVRGDPEGAATIEANSSKPRSLASPDNSKFS